MQCERQGQGARGFGGVAYGGTQRRTRQPLEVPPFDCYGGVWVVGGRLQGQAGGRQVQGRGRVGTLPTPAAVAAPCDGGARRRQPNCPALPSQSCLPSSPPRPTPPSKKGSRRPLDLPPATNQPVRPASLAPAGHQLWQLCAPLPAPPGSGSSKRQVDLPPWPPKQHPTHPAVGRRCHVCRGCGRSVNSSLHSRASHCAKIKACCF